MSQLEGPPYSSEPATVQGRKIFIAGLPEDTQQADLQDCFGQIGPILSVEMKKGYGFVEFDNPQHSIDAVAKYDQGSFLGAQIKVQISHGQGPRSKTRDDHQGPPSMASGVNALAPGARAGDSNPGPSSSSGPPGRRPPHLITCFRCGETGHYARGPNGVSCSNPRVEGLDIPGRRRSIGNDERGLRSSRNNDDDRRGPYGGGSDRRGPPERGPPSGRYDPPGAGPSPYGDRPPYGAPPRDYGPGADRRPYSPQDRDPYARGPPSAGYPGRDRPGPPGPYPPYPAYDRPPVPYEYPSYDDRGYPYPPQPIRRDYDYPPPGDYYNRGAPMPPASPYDPYAPLPPRAPYGAPPPDFRPTPYAGGPRGRSPPPGGRGPRGPADPSRDAPYGADRYNPGAPADRRTSNGPMPARRRSLSPARRTTNLYSTPLPPANGSNPTYPEANGDRREPPRP